MSPVEMLDLLVAFECGLCVEAGSAEDAARQLEADGARKLGRVLHDVACANKEDPGRGCLRAARAWGSRAGHLGHRGILASTDLYPPSGCARCIWLGLSWEVGSKRDRHRIAKWPRPSNPRVERIESKKLMIMMRMMI